MDLHCFLRWLSTAKLQFLTFDLRMPSSTYLGFSSKRKRRRETLETNCLLPVLQVVSVHGLCVCGYFVSVALPVSIYHILSRAFLQSLLILLKSLETTLLAAPHWWPSSFLFAYSVFAVQFWKRDPTRSHFSFQFFLTLDWSELYGYWYHFGFCWNLHYLEARSNLPSYFLLFVAIACYYRT